MIAWRSRHGIVISIVTLIAGCDPVHVSLGETRSSLVGAELAVDTPVPSPEPGDQSQPHVACAGETCVAVWSSTRSGIPAAVQAARVDGTTGVVLDTSALVISGSLAGGSQGSISCAGSDCVVVWPDTRNGNANPDVFGTRLDASTGVIGDVAGIAIATTPDIETAPLVSCCADACLIAWNDFTTGQTLARRISPTTGALDDPDGIVLPIPSVDAAACTGTDWFVASTVNNGLGARVSGAGVLLDPIAFPLSSVDSQPDQLQLACTGTDCLAVWTDYRNELTNSYDIYGSRIDAAAGATRDPADIPISAALRQQDSPSVACTGSTCVVAWDDFRATGAQTQVYGARVDLSTGDVVDSTGFPIFTTGGASVVANPEQLPAVACGTSGCLVAWQDYLVDEHVYASRVDPATAAVGDPNGIVLALAPDAEHAPAVACSDGGCAAVWLDARAVLERAYGVRIDVANGVVLDPAATQLTRYANRARLACGSTDCLIVWEAPGGDGELVSDAIYAVRASRTGFAADGAAFAIATNSFVSSPSVACSDDACVIVWVQSSTIMGTRVDLGTGGVAEPDGVVLSTQAGFSPVVSCAGTNCLVAWTGDRIYAARFDLSSGAIADPDGLALSSAAGYVPAVSCSGASCLVTWQEKPTSGTWEIHGGRVDVATGIVSDAELSIALTSVATLTATASDVACEGSDCVVVWQDLRNADPDMFITRVDKRTDSVLDPTGRALTATPELESSPAIAVDGNGHYLVAYSRPDVAIQNVERVVARVVELRAAGQPCADNAECFDDACVANICGGPLVDAGVGDAPAADGGLDAAPGTGLTALSSPGCGCSGGTPSTGVVFVLVALFVVRRRTSSTPGPLFSRVWR